MSYHSSVPKSVMDAFSAIIGKQHDLSQLDELSKDTMKSYVKKATKSADKAYDKAGKEEDKAMSTDGEKYPEKQKRHNDAANKHIQTWRKRQKGLDMAKESTELDEGRGKKGRERHSAVEDEWGDEPKDKKKMKPDKPQKKAVWDESYAYYVIDEDLGVGEVFDVKDSTYMVVFETSSDFVVEKYSIDNVFVEDFDPEQLDEISKDTIKSYQTKASAEIAGSIKKGKPSKATVAMRTKRGVGLERAKEKLNAIIKKEHDANMEHAKKLNGMLDHHFETEAPKVLAKHGYSKVHSHKDVDSYIKKHDNGHVSLVSIHRIKPNDWSGHGGHQVRVSNSKGNSWGAYHAHNGAYDNKDFDNHIAKMMPKFESHLISTDEHTSTDDRW